MRSRMTGLCLVAALVLPACSSEAVKRGTYEALHQKQCIDRTGAANCEPEHPDYDQYTRDRDEALRGR